MSDLDAALEGVDDELRSAPDGELDTDDLDLEQAGDNLDLDNPDDEDGDPDELEDYDVDGKTIQVSKAVKEALEKGQLRHADYTRKTMEAAEIRKAAETERAAVRAEGEANQVFLREKAQLLVLDEQIAQFENVDWAAALATDEANGTQKVTAARLELEQLQKQRAQLAGGIHQKATERANALQQETAKQAEACHDALTKEFPKWAEERPQLEAFAKQNGVSDDELKTTTDPRIFRLLRFAKIGLEVEQRRQATSTIQKSQQVTPVPVLGATPRRGPPTARDQDRMSTEDWMKMERQRLAKKSGARR